MVVHSSDAACQTSTCVTNITRTLFQGNRAREAGALSLLAQGIEYNISQSKFVANRAFNGSAAAVQYFGYSSLGSNNNSSPSQSKLSISNTDFIRNMAIAAKNCYGGALHAALNGTSMQVDACAFEENVADTTENMSSWGGGVFVLGFGDLLINNGSFSNNTGEVAMQVSSATNLQLRHSLLSWL